MSDYQPIATAPMDGTLVLVWSPSGGGSTASNTGNGWYLQNGERLQRRPTHWMPTVKAALEKP